MTQEEVVEFLKRRSPERFTASELQKYLNLGAGLYENLKRLRPHCKAGHPVFGYTSTCGWCSSVVESDGFRCVKSPHQSDSRRHVFFYWWQK